MPVLQQHQIPRWEVRAPTTDPTLDRGRMLEFLREHVHPTGVHEPTVLHLNLEGRFLGAGALYELMVPLGKAVVGGEYGPLSIVVSASDEATREIVRALAARYELPVYLAPGIDTLEGAEPAGLLTSTQQEVLAALWKRGGRASVAQVAAAAGATHRAAGNVLSDLADGGLVFRMPGAGRRGHLYVDPRAAVPAEEPADPDALDFDVPADVRADVRALAEVQGREPGAVLQQAWAEFLTTHRERMAADSRRMAEHMARDDRAAMAKEAARFARQRATAASRATKSRLSTE